MKKLGLALALVLALLLALAQLWDRPRSKALPIVPTTPHAQPVAAPKAGAELAPGELAEPSLAPDEARGPREVAATPPADEPAASPVGGAVVRGRVLFPGARPALGATVHIRGFVANTDRRIQFGVPEDWVDPTGESGEDGRFEVRFDPPRAYQFLVKVHLPGFAEESWRWSALEPNQVRDLGDIRLRPTGSIEGHVVDSSGKPMKHPWRIYGNVEPVDGESDGRDRTSVRASCDPETGHFLLQELPGGPVQLEAHSQIAGWIKGPVVQVEVGRTTEADIVFTGPDPSSRIEVTTYSRPFHILAGRAEHVRLVGQGYDSETQRRAGTSSSFSFDGLEPGLYTVVIDDPLFEPFTKDGVRPGERVSAELVPNAGLQLTLTDGATGLAIETARLLLRLEDYPNTRPNTFELFAEGALPADGILPPVPPGDTTLLVEAPGFAQAELAVLGLQPGEVRPVSLELSPAASIRGQVRTAAGALAENVQVLLMPPGAAPAGKKNFFGGSPGYVEALEETRTDAEGRFAFESLLPGSYDLFAVATPWLLAEAKGLVLEGGQDKNVPLSFPAGAELDVRVTGLAAELPDDFQLIVRSASEPTLVPGFRRASSTYQGNDTLLGPATDGVWLARDLPPGPCELLLGRPFVVVKHGSGTTSTSATPFLLGSAELKTGQRTKLEYDLAASAPGKLIVDVVVDGLAVPGAQVFALDPSNTPTGTAATGAKGRAVIDGLFPGPISLRADFQTGASFQPAEQYSIPPGGASQARIELWLRTGQVRLVDADGAALAGIQASAKGAEFTASLQTDANGLATLVAPAGSYELHYWSFDATQKKALDLTATLQWPSGPVEVIEVTFGK